MPNYTVSMNRQPASSRLTWSIFVLVAIIFTGGLVGLIDSTFDQVSSWQTADTVRYETALLEQSRRNN
jgi:hypothetical protein